MVFHTIASYNMSFASDMGVIQGYETEQFFMRNARKRKGINIDKKHEKTEKNRELWERAKSLVKHFWENEKNATFMGLQEMNMTALVNDEIGGNEAIINMLDSKKDLSFESSYVYITDTQIPALLSIWNHERLGRKVKVYVADLGDTPPYKELEEQKGRPISIIYTTKRYTLINLHGLNYGRAEQKKSAKNISKAIEHHIKESQKDMPDSAKDKFTKNKIYITGDFNDPTHVLKNIEINKHTYDNGSSDNPIFSCCYSFGGIGKKLEGTPGPYEKNPKESGLYLENTTIDNYAYTGDYVFSSQNIKERLEIYRPHEFKHKGNFTLESDHEMVYATFEADTNSGGYRKTRKYKK
jgi:hypothetical protein